MLDQLTDGQLQWEPLENPFDHVVIGPPENRRRYPIYSGRKRFPEELKKCFPGEEAAIDEYLNLVKVGVSSGKATVKNNSFENNEDLTMKVICIILLPYQFLRCFKLDFDTNELYHADFCQCCYRYWSRFKGCAHPLVGESSYIILYNYLYCIICQSFAFMHS